MQDNDANLPVPADESSDDADDIQQVTRDTLGRFVSGVSGNPVGRTRGSRNRASLVREAIEEAVQRGLSERVQRILDAALTLAEDGDKQMIKLTLGDMLKPARSADPNAGKGAPRKVVLKVTQNFGRRPEPQSPAIDAEFKSSEDSEHG